LFEICEFGVDGEEDNVDFSNILNRKLSSVELTKDKESIVFRFESGAPRAFGVEGECCSHSWIEHLDMPTDIHGATLLSVEDGAGVPWDGHECNPACGHGSLAVYNTKFRTDRGDIVLEYRNDSNGYYGGYLVDATVEGQ
jgi:hypothetical protein